MDEAVMTYIESLSDANLVDYVRADPEMYRPEAVAFARQEDGA